MRASPWIAGACAAAVAACGGTPTQHTRAFSAAGMRIHFRYPADFRRFSVSYGRGVKVVRMGIPRRPDLCPPVCRAYTVDSITVVLLPPLWAVTARKAKPALDRSLSQLLERPMAGTISTVRGGLMIVSYPWTLVPEPHLGATLRVTDIATGRQLYEIECGVLSFAI
jgi:hypothetical protein